jgi:hypothetical protein
MPILTTSSCSARKFLVAILQPGTVVTIDIPEYAIAVGNPAKVAKYRE